MTPTLIRLDLIPEEKWSPGMKKVADYVVFLGKELMEAAVKRSGFVRTTNNFPGLLRFSSP